MGFPKSGAIRSDAAIARRAAKRGVTFEEQLQADLRKTAEERQKRKEDKAEKVPQLATESLKRKKKRMHTDEAQEPEGSEVARDSSKPLSKKRTKTVDVDPRLDFGNLKLEEFIANNPFDSRCLYALRLLNPKQADWVMKWGVEADPAKGTVSALVSA